MAVCIYFDRTDSGQDSAIANEGYNVLPWHAGTATFSAGSFSCAEGSHLLMSIAEVNAMPKTGVPDEALMRDNFFMSFTLVLSCYLLGKFVGAVLHTVRKG